MMQVLPPLATDTSMQQIGVSVLLVYVLEWLKQSKLPFITATTDTLNRVISFVVAFLMSCGVVFIANPGGWLNGGGTIQVPALLQVVNTLLHTFGQFGLQQTYYHLVVKPTPPPALVGMALKPTPPAPKA